MSSSSVPPEEQPKVKPFDPLVLDRTVIAIPLLKEMQEDLERVKLIEEKFPDAVHQFNAAIEYMWPSRERRPRALHPRRWIRLEKDKPSSGPEPIAQSADPPWPPDPIVRPADPVARSDPTAQVPDSRGAGATQPSRPQETGGAAPVDSPVVGSGPFRFGRRRRQPSDPPPGGRLS
jgi:hypothetical protein